jgi:polar amino acid transport system permease protein
VRDPAQAVRITLPPIGNTFVSMLKDSSLIAVLAVTDLMRRG